MSDKARSSGQARRGRSADGQGDAPLDQPFANLRNEFDRLFEEFANDLSSGFRWRTVNLGPFGRLEAGFSGPTEVIPKLDIVETDIMFLVSMELPGMDADELDISLADGILTVQGEKRRDEAAMDGRDHLSERQYGTVHRAFRLSDGVDGDAASAALERGVLTIRLPKRSREEASKRRVRITPD